MRRLLKKLGIEGLVIAFTMLMAVSAVVYAYTAITVMSEVEVQEPISIALVEGDGTFDGDTSAWDIGDIYPLDTKSITITFANAADGPITLTLTCHPASLDDGNLTFTFDSETVEVPAGEIATATLTANTTQSLAPGSYSTEITVER